MSHEVRRRKARADRGCQAPVNNSVPGLAAGLFEVAKDNANNEGGLYTFTKRNDERLKHVTWLEISSRAWAGRFKRKS